MALEQKTKAPSTAKSTSLPQASRPSGQEQRAAQPAPLQVRKPAVSPSAPQKAAVPPAALPGIRKPAGGLFPANQNSVKGTQGLPSFLGQLAKPLATMTPEQQKQLGKLNGLVKGQQVPAVNKDVATLLDQTPFLNHFLNTKLGTGNTANILSGTMRNLATLPNGKANQLQNYRRRTIQTPAEIAGLSSFLSAQKKAGQTNDLLKNFNAFGGRDLYTVLGERVTNPAARAKLLTNLPAPVPQAQLTRLAFLESLSSDNVYSSEKGKTMTTSGKAEKKGGIPSEVLKTFGYTADDNIAGGWGMDFRLFRPKDKSQPIIIAMRGTEGVAFDVKANRAGTVDTALGDFAPAEPGINQFEPNRSALDKIVQQATKNGQKIIWTGHSLGGALAQEGAATYPEATASVATFQAANIPQAYVDRFKAYTAAHPKNPIDVTHMRVDGDSVPTSGTAALPGTIHYLDYMSRVAGKPGDMTISPVSELLPGIKNPALKDAASAAASKIPLVSTSSVSTGHVIPTANMLLRQSYGGSTDARTQAMMKYGPKDPTTLSGKVESAVVYGGKYTAATDPRLALETQRRSVGPQILNLSGAGAGAFQASAPLSNAREVLGGAAPAFANFEEFQKYAATLANGENMPMTARTLSMGRQMGLGTDPRRNARAAANDLFGLNTLTAATTGFNGPLLAGNTVRNIGKTTDRPWTGLAAGVGISALSIPMGPMLGANAAALFEGGLRTLPDTPVLDHYKTGKNGDYVVPVDSATRFALNEKDYLMTIWRTHHPDRKGTP